MPFGRLQNELLDTYYNGAVWSTYLVLKGHIKHDIQLYDPKWAIRLRQRDHLVKWRGKAGLIVLYGKISRHHHPQLI